MLIWVIIAIAWIAVLIAGISLYRLTAYAEKKFRAMLARSRHSENVWLDCPENSVVPKSQYPSLISKRDNNPTAGKDVVVQA